MMNNKPGLSMFKMRILSSIFILLLSLNAFAQKTGYEIWNQMTEAGLTFDKSHIVVDGAKQVNLLDQDGKQLENAGRMVMFGGEKEGSSSLITRIMGPNKEGFKSYVESLPASNKEEFIRNLLSDFTSGKIRVKTVQDMNGNVIPFDLTDLKNVDYKTLPQQELMKKFDLFLERGGDKFFSHLSKPTRIKIFNGNYPGLSGHGMKKMDKWSLYHSFVPLYGNAEKFIDAAHGTSVGWEINFNPQKSYGEFEFMIDWFRNELKNVGQKFEAPGHQWIVYPKTKNVADNAEESAKIINKLGEVHKNVQAYIVLKGIEGGAGIELSNYKNVQHDNTLLSDHSTGRGVIRLENGRFNVDGNDAFAIEFRAGTKSDNIRRMTQKMLVSRYAANEFDDLADGASWTLVGRADPDDYWGPLHTKESLIKRFNVSPLEANKFFDVMDKATMSKNKGGWAQEVKISQDYLAPLWNWENAPYISATKKEELRNLTRTYIKTVANIKNPDIGSVRAAMKDWVKTSQVALDIENYLKPKQKLKNPANAHKYDLKFGAKVDVNEIDMGIEYSARYPLKSNAQFVEVPGQPGKFEWVHTNYGYSETERKAVIERFAKTLSKELNDGVLGEVTNLNVDGHGHGLDIAYEVKDKNGKKWRVEWDGIGRSYDLDSKRIDDSVRGGHVEIVTPKFVPDEEAMQKLYTAMEKENLIPSTRFGGGHINIDLKPFENNPKAFARFLGAYLDNRDIMSMMFQHIGRQVGAEPVKVSQEAINWLKNFNGTETELKQFLYDQRFFNTRVGRKTKNNQLNLLAYIQDVIPEEFIHADFDMKNDMWRQTFDVDPKIRKMEFRMFNAPRNSQEAALQIKFTKALLNKALNDTDEVFVTSGKVDYKSLVDDPKAAMAKFEKTMKNLGLDADEYRGFMLEGMEVSKHTLSSESFLPLEKKLALHPETDGWGKAVEPRVNNPISSADRVWDGKKVLPEAIAFKQQQMIAREHAQQAKNRIDKYGRLDRKLERTPLEVNIDLKDIKNLNDQDAMVALYYQKSKLKDPERQKYLKELVSSESFKDNLPEMISNSREISPGYQKFLAENLPSKFTKDHKNTYLDSYRHLLESEDAIVRKRAISYLSSHPEGLTTMLERADELASRTLIREVMEATKSIPLSQQNLDEIAILNQLVLKTDDPASVQQMMKLAEQLDVTAHKEFLASMSDHPSLQLKELAHRQLRTKYEKDYYFQAKERLAGNATPDDKRLYNKFLKETKVFDNISTSELAKVPEEFRLGIAKKLLDNPDLNGMKRKTILDKLATPEGHNLLRRELEIQGTDPDLKKWAYEKYTGSSLYDPKDPMNAEAIKGLLLAEDAEVNKLGMEMMEKINSPSVREQVIPEVLSHSSINDNVKTQLYSKLLESPEMINEMVKYDPVIQSSLLEAIERDLKIPGQNRARSATVLSKLYNKGNERAHSILLKMAESQEPSLRNAAMVIYENTDTKLTHETISHFLGKKPLTPAQIDMIQRGQAKHAEFLKNLSKSDLADKKTIDKLWFLYKHSLLSEKSNELNIIDILKNDPKLFEAIGDYLEEANVKGKSDPFAQWLVQLSSKPELKKLAGKEISSIKEIAYHALSSTDEVLQDEALKLLKSQNISALDFIANDGRFSLTMYDDHYNTVVKEDLIRLLDKVEKTPADLKLLQDNSSFHNELANALRGKTVDPKSKTTIAQLMQKIPGSAMDQQLYYLTSWDTPKQTAIILKNRRSVKAFEAMKELEKSGDPMSKRYAKEGILSMMKESRELKSFAGMETGEILSMIYYKNNNLKGNVDISDLLKDIPDKDSFVHYFKTVIEDYYAPDKYKVFLMEILEKPENIKALGIKRKDLYSMLGTALEYHSSGPVNDAIMKLIRVDKLGTAGDKAKLIVNRSYTYTENSMETLKFLATKDPQGDHFVKAVESIFQNPWHYEDKPSIKRKSAELLMVMPQGSVDQVIKNVKQGNQNDKLLLLGVAKHRSAEVKKLADTHAKNTSVDVKMQQTAQNIQQNIKEKGVIKGPQAKSKCVTKSVRTILQRLSFR